jgi:hypothetical protein
MSTTASGGFVGSGIGTSVTATVPATPEKIIKQGTVVGGVTPSDPGAWKTTRSALAKCLRANGWHADLLLHPRRVRARSALGKRVTWTVFFRGAQAERATFVGDPASADQRTLVRCLR